MALTPEIYLKPLQNRWRRGHFIPDDVHLPTNPVLEDVDVTLETVTTLGAIHKEDFDTILLQFITTGPSIDFQFFGSAMDDESHGTVNPYMMPPEDDSREWMMLPAGELTVPGDDSLARLINDRYTWIMIKYKLTGAAGDSAFTVRIRAD